MPLIKYRRYRPNHAAVMVPAPAGGYTATGVRFDTSTRTNRGGQLTGIADSKVGTVSFWVKFTGTTPPEIIEQNFGSGGGFTITRSTAGNGSGLTIRGENSAASLILFHRGGITLTAGTWYHVLAAWDLAAGLFPVYITDAVDTPTSSVITNDTINYASSGGQWWCNTNFNDDFSVADLWLNTATYVDITNVTERRKFISAGGGPVDLGSTGQTPTGGTPILFFKGPFGSWNTNLGTGGNFSTNAGALQAAASNPP